MRNITRRQAIGAMAALPAAAAQRPGTANEAGGSVVLNWLDGAPPSLSTGVSWGVPWPRGTVKKEQTFTLTAETGAVLPLQTWPLAYWPDGSLKFSGFATVAGPDAGSGLRLTQGNSTAPPAAAVEVHEDAQGLRVINGAMFCVISRQSGALFESIAVEGKQVATNARLVSVLQNAPDGDATDALPRESFTGQVKKITVEQSGPVRAVVKFEGVHRSANGTREWLPFVVRLYFYAGQIPVRMVHTFVFDGDDRKDFIRALGVQFDVPMREEVYNRHVRFSGEGDGLWAEPLQPLAGRGRGPREGGNDIYADQLAGKPVPPRNQLDERTRNFLKDWAVWDSFKLVQHDADAFSVYKRTNKESCWLKAGCGRRASGLVFAGDTTGGLGVALRNFWQSYPNSLEVRDTIAHTARLYVWLWSPDGPVMDLRHYDTRAHGLDASYEDVQEGFSTANGIARTHELTLYPTSAVPTREEAVQQARLNSQTPLLVCSPQTMHAAKVLGIWSLPDRSTPAKRTVEDSLDAAITQYQQEIEQRGWYGFWDFGDVMHAQDPPRHVWRYDVGGFAWDNTELGTDLWLWYTFLRTGRADVFRMAEAMTRHTSEVDTYHSGRFAMLGSRHNVRHWGDGAKECRISQAAFRRPYYYLTTDERTGDILREVVDVDYKVCEIDPMRIAVPKSQMPSSYPGRVRGGPDWLAFIGNWMTEWERTGDTKWRDKIVAGMDSIAAMRYGFLSGPYNLYGYDPKTGKLYTLVDDPFGTYNLTTIQGGAEVVFELNELIYHPGWHKAWLQHCRLTRASKEVVAKDMQTGNEGADGSLSGGGRLAAYVYAKTGNEAFLREASRQLFGGGMFRIGTMYETTKVNGPLVLNPIVEAPRMSTNSVAQTSLTAMEVLDLCGAALPAEIPPQTDVPPGARGGRRRGM